MKLIDVDSKETLEDFLRKCNEKISGNKNELALRASNANQVIYGANSSFDDDVKYDKDSVEDREVPLIIWIEHWVVQQRKYLPSN